MAKPAEIDGPHPHGPTRQSSRIASGQGRLEGFPTNLLPQAGGACFINDKFPVRAVTEDKSSLLFFPKRNAGQATLVSKFHETWQGGWTGTLGER